MTSINEHGPVRDIERADDPEWWARGGEPCTCGHRIDEHAESVSERWPCSVCDCSDCDPA